MMQLHHIWWAAWCTCITLVAAGCVRFQSGPSETLPQTERLQLAGRGQLRVVDKNSGAAETVLLVHGYGASSASYAPVIAKLAERFRVLAVDLPGFGLSDRRPGDYSPEGLADVLARILDEKQVQKAHVVGHSWGSSVVLAFALRHPQRLDKLAVISAWIYDDQLLPFMRWARVRGLGEMLYGMFYRQNLGERLYLNFYDPSLVTQAVVDEVERQMARPGALAAALAAVRGMKFREDDYKKIAAPTLILWGREDRVARLAFGERLARELPSAQLVVLGRCGHIPMWECTGETAGTLRAFLEGAR
jgi:pimeloyl-ACP methyl ester carboxylesterase